MYAVTIEPMPSTSFLLDRPEGELWKAIANNTKVEVQEGVSIDPIPDEAELFSWPRGAYRPERVLCRSRTDPNRYRVYKYSRDIDRSEFVPTGKIYGGIYSKETWERFLELLPAHLKFMAIPDTDPPGVMEEALRNIRGGR